MEGLKILNKCPICGAKLEYSALMQYSNVYDVLKNGELSKRRKRKEDNGTMECGYISCTNENCDFATDCDYRAENHEEIRIYQDHSTLMYEIDESRRRR